ncbi:peptide-methionine (S)-S-oxide reductase MsrA [Lewinella sp. W8]|uniref:peptide-methionine (S)-S-oxide reductase MsrA n=1 Tax=Lewinella sp. W8 TaxID=2528208 RepID=UPI00106765E6|nr:peptide-methionine (S)-S-oxide reductase MsrA [Lewinella sp. W8]MTB52018.1 peptide-methionine (S)-S-oxide reductase MsrA [Lewinella sp. W8]
MKQSLFSLSLFLIFMLFAQSCDSQKANSANAQNKEVANTATASPLAGDMSIEELDARYEGFEKAYLAGGCFWCTEAAIDRIMGVEDVWSGYAGGKEKNPTYRQVASGATGHAEAIVVYYDPEVISYETLLDVFFVAHDPTQLNRQGPDVGPQYRSAIFPLNDEQRQRAEAKIAELNASGKFSKTLATTIEDPIQFYLAEGYHQDYYEDPTNPNQGYVQNVSRPKVEKVMKVFADRLKPEFKK